MSSILNLRLVFDALQPMTVIVTLSVAVYAMYRYLNSVTKTSGAGESSLSKDVVGRLKLLEERISNTNEDNNISETDRMLLLKKIQERIESDVNVAYLDNLKRELESKSHNEILKGLFESSISRLKGEVKSLVGRGNFNLAIGAVIGLAGLFFIYFYVMELPASETSVELLSQTLPRVSILLLISLLATFFLNLYRKSLEEIKYYQNEITNLESKYLSLHLACQMRNHKTNSIIIESLIKTERNFILEKNQTTIELEKERMSSDSTNKVVEVLKDALSVKNKPN